MLARMKTLPWLWLLLAGCLSPALVCGAARPLDPDTDSAEAFFGPDRLYTFRLTIAPDQWATMEDVSQPQPGADRRPGGNGPLVDREYKSGRATLEFEGRPAGTISVRFKGNSSFNFSRNSLKHSLKLDFNEVDPDRTFFGLTKLNLNNNAMDPSQLREALAYDIFRHAGVPAGRTAFARVFLTVPGCYDHAYVGLYTIVEQVDARFLKSRFGVKDGLLLKPERVQGLPYWGDDWAAYTNRMQPKTKATAADTARYLEFVKNLNLAADAPFQATLTNFVDVDAALRFLAVQALLANMDSPLLTGHNYYLWLHPRTRQFHWLPWDLNEAFGGFNPAGTTAQQLDLSVNRPFTRANRFAERLLAAPGVSARYHDLVRGLLATNFNAGRLFPLIETMAATIRPALTNDRQVSLPQFESALSAAQPAENATDRDAGGGPGRPPGAGRPRTPLKAFITQRVNSVQRQLAGESSGYVPTEMRPGMMGGPGFGPGPGPGRPPLGPPPR